MKARTFFTKAFLVCVLIIAPATQAREKSCPSNDHEVAISFHGTSKLNLWGIPIYFGNFEMDNKGTKSIRIYTEIYTDKQKMKHSTVHPLFVELQRLENSQWVKAIKAFEDDIAPGIMIIIHPGDSWDFYVEMDSLVEHPDAADQEYRLLLRDTSECPYFSEAFTITRPR